MSSQIEWTDETWNPTVGCRKVSPGCENCYAIREAHRMAGNPNPKIRQVYEGLTVRPGKGPANWSGQVRFVEERLEQPLRWRKPRRVFVDSMSDLFHEDISFLEIERVFEVMGEARQHTFQVLTKRGRRMWEFCQWLVWPFPKNVWLGVSVENQDAAYMRIPWLLKTPATVKFLSCEPLLGPLDISLFLASGYEEPPYDDIVNWVIVGGESGPNARPMHPHWAMSIRDQCLHAEVPFFFKQQGGWEPIAPVWANCGLVAEATEIVGLGIDGTKYSWMDDRCQTLDDDAWCMGKVGKKAAGRLLDGVEWNQLPEAGHA